jgi:hypothetical protein
MRKREMPALRIHDVEIELVAQVRKQRNRLGIERHAFDGKIVRAYDGGVPRGVAAGQISLFQNGDIANAMILGEVIGGREPMAAAADDHHVVALTQRLGCGQDALWRSSPETLNEKSKRHCSAAGFRVYATAQQVYEAPGCGGTCAILATIPFGSPAAYGQAARRLPNFRSGGCVRGLAARIALVQSGAGMPGFRKRSSRTTVLCARL